MSPPAVLANLSVPARAAEAVERGAEGVGLMRAEFLVYRTGRHPLVLLDEPPPRDLEGVLAEGMATVARAFHPRPVLYRSLDLRSNELRNLAGGAEREVVEENPALGLRGASRSRHAPATFEAELKALAGVRQSGLDNLHLMLPFVRWPEEVAWARGQLRGAGAPQLWTMVETPAAMLRADELAPLVDGVSIGSNDLAQLVLGVDRDNPAFAAVDWDEDPAVLAALELTVERFRAAGVPVGICGDAPSRSDALVARLLDWGVSSVSVSLDRLHDVRRRLGASTA